MDAMAAKKMAKARAKKLGGAIQMDKFNDSLVEDVGKSMSTLTISKQLMRSSNKRLSPIKETTDDVDAIFGFMEADQSFVDRIISKPMGLTSSVSVESSAQVTSLDRIMQGCGLGPTIPRQIEYCVHIKNRKDNRNLCTPCQVPAEHAGKELQDLILYVQVHHRQYLVADAINIDFVSSIDLFLPDVNDEENKENCTMLHYGKMESINEAENKYRAFTQKVDSLAAELAEKSAEEFANREKNFHKVWKGIPEIDNNGRQQGVFLGKPKPVILVAHIVLWLDLMSALIRNRLSPIEMQVRVL